MHNQMASLSFNQIHPLCDPDDGFSNESGLAAQTGHCPIAVQILKPNLVSI
jgi:hypothetical protein